MSCINIKDPEEYKKIISSNKVTVALFSAEWADQCKQVLDVMKEISEQEKDKLQFINIPAEDMSEISLKHQIEAVPTVIFFQSGNSLDRIDGVNISALTSKCKKFAGEKDLDERLKELVNKSRIMVFMKGDRDTPRCGFSKQLIAIMNETGAQYETFDILKDEEVRQGLKTLFDWPTYPQLYVNGELIGGLDIVKELRESGEFEQILKG